MDASILKLHHFKDTLTTNPHDRSFSQRLLGIDRDEWLELRNKTLDHINSLLIEEEGVKYLPEGTLSIAETAKMDKNGKLTGVPKHEVLFNMKRRFMSEVQGVRGDMSPYNIALYRSNVYIGLLMQFKTWMPAMVEDRLGMTKFDIYKDAFKTGRYRATWNAGGLFQKNMPETEEGVTEELAWSALAVSKLKALQGLIHTSVKLNSYTLAKK